MDDGEDREGIVQAFGIQVALKDRGAPTQGNSLILPAGQPQEDRVRQPQPAQAQGARQAVQLHWRDARIVRHAASEPIISVDAKKKEQIGNFKNGGRAWDKQATPVYDHDFPVRRSAAVVAPLWHLRHPSQPGLYLRGDLSGNVRAFAVDSIERCQWKDAKDKTAIRVSPNWA